MLETEKSAPDQGAEDNESPEIVAKGLPGRPRHEPDDKSRKIVQFGAAFGLTEVQLSKMLGISPPTLRQYYFNELEAGFIKANYAVAMNLFRQATKDDHHSVRAAEFWLRCRAGWHEAGVADQIGKKAAAIVAAKNPDKSTDMGELMAKRAEQTLN